MTEPFDIAVIGAGSGDLVAAVAGAKFGQKVVLFEKDRMDSECLNTGCLPLASPWYRDFGTVWLI